MKIRTEIRKRYVQQTPKHDFLKYWKVVRQWAKSKYGLGVADIEMMLFIYSEGLFTKKDFEEYNEIMSWDRNRFHNLLKDRRANPIFDSNTNYSQKVYRKIIKKMNQEIKKKL